MNSDEALSIILYVQHNYQRTPVEFDGVISTAWAVISKEAEYAIAVYLETEETERKTST